MTDPTIPTNSPAVSGAQPQDREPTHTQLLGASPTEGMPEASPPQPNVPSGVSYLPPPSGPHWGLVLTGLFFVVVAAGVVANQVNGFQLQQITRVAPSAVILAGLACALVGVVGMVRHRPR